MSKKKILIGTGVAVAVLGLGALAMAADTEKGAPVRTEVVARRDLVSIVTASGKIEPKRKVDISADISGRVTQVAVEEGQWVNRGDLLLRIDPTAYQAMVRKAEASVAQAQAQASLARANLLKARSEARRAEQMAQGRDLISAQDLEQARTAVQVQEAQFEAAQHQVAQMRAGLTESRNQASKTTISAPMSGRVTRLNIEEGETAIVGTMNNPGSLLLTIADLSVMEATVKVDETDVPRITFGDSAVVRIDAFPNQTFTGKVTRIANSSLQGTGVQAPTSDQQSVDFEVVITLDNPPAELRPDLSATADIVTEAKTGALSIPIIALVARDRDGKKFKAATDQDGGNAADAEKDAKTRREKEEVEGVFVVGADKKVRFVPVQIGIAGDRYFEVANGLKGGEVVVSGTYQAIRELETGMLVKQETPAAAGKKDAAGDAKEKK